MKTTTKTPFVAVGATITFLPTGKFSFQVFQPVRSGNGLLVGTDTMKCFLEKLGQKYNVMKKSDSQCENPISTEPSIN